MRLLQIVPHLPPTVSGVGDYALILARALRERHDLQTTFAVAHPSREGTEHDGFAVIPLPHAAAILSRLAHLFERVLLHYVGYGYHERGCPIWLVRGLGSSHLARSTKKGARSVAPLITMFHELFAFGPPWRSSFWTHPIQRWICCRLARQSLSCVTNRTQSVRALEDMRQLNGVKHLPVFSNVGELRELPSLAGRNRRMVLFGGEGWRRTAITKDLAALQQACRALGITEIIEIGPGNTPKPEIGISWRAEGCLSPSEISHRMRDAVAGFLSYPTHCLGKSGILAAYAAHGLMPVLPARCMQKNSDGLVPGEHFVFAEQLTVDHGSMVQVPITVFNWYRGHRIELQANEMARLITQGEGSRQ
ncbi:MAG: glycosyltransferase family 1 protein [Verrucomicrobiota bacterium]